MTQAAPRIPLLAYAFLGGALAFAGPPIYMHAPRAYSTIYEIDLGRLGIILASARVIDFIQDPVLGRLIKTYRNQARYFAFGFSGLLAIGVGALFFPIAPIDPLIWFTISVIAAFTGFSGLQILYYSLGVSLAGSNTDHARIAAWRESCALIGVSLAAITPTVALVFFSQSFAYFTYAIILSILLMIAITTLYWRNSDLLPPASTDQVGFFDLLGDRQLRSLLLIGFINGLPYGFTATLFFFFVEDRLEAATQAGFMLLLFFASAAIAAPVWGRLSVYFGAKRTLIAGMLLAILTFSGALFLGAGDAAAFYIVCITSGAAVSADMTLIPAMLSQRLGKIGGTELAFGLWGGLSKATLAIAAGIALPGLALAGYGPGIIEPNSAYALSFFYAGIPLILKLVAIVLLIVTIKREGT